MNLEYPLNEENYHAYRHIEIIKCKENKTIIIGWNSCETQFSALVIHRVKAHEQLRSLKELALEVGPTETYDNVKEQLNKAIGDFHQRESIYAVGIVGLHRFLQGYYLMYIKESLAIAKIGRHKIYEVKSTEILPLFQPRADNTKKNEAAYLAILSGFKLQNFYYSYTYDMTNPLPKNMVRNAKPFFSIDHKTHATPISQQPDLNRICECFHYNYQSATQLSSICRNPKWIIALIHGYCKHINVKFKGTMFNVIFIARRSRHHAGTRYIKRGISANGFPANYVEIQQIVINFSSSQDTRPVCSSYLQMRGSVPTYWMQRPSIATPKPAIEIRSDDYLLVGTRKHFHDVVARYGRIIYCVNLMKIKQKLPRESPLSKQYQNAIAFINKEDIPEQQAIHYVQIDMKYNLKLDKALFVSKIKTLAYYTLMKTGLFLCLNHSTSSHEQYIQFQNGVIRANCVDCLDRTNSFQQLIGETILTVQLNRLMGEDIHFENLQLELSILEEYSQLYEEMGDLISIQYGSSLAHKQKIQKTTESRFEFLTSIKRHVNNNFKDYDRQEQIDVFLGYCPDPTGPQLWQTRPPIEHFPNQFVNRFQKYRWFAAAYNYFLDDYSLRHFEAITRQWVSDVNLPKFERIGKETLMTKFNAEIVNNLLNDKEDCTLRQYFVMPKLILEKRVWKQMNPRSKEVKSLQEQLSYCYNKMDFLTEAQNPLTCNVLNSPLRASKDVKKSQRALRNAFHSLDEDDDFLDQIDKFVINDLLDNQEMQLIERYFRGELTTEEQVEKTVLEMFSDINRECIDAVPEERETQIIMKELERNIGRRNYVTRQESEHQKPLEVKTLKVVEQKKECVRDNKVRMLEQIMMKNFSHGSIGCVTEV